MISFVALDKIFLTELVFVVASALIVHSTSQFHHG
jgi:hypothetical protein